jgi:hypothetical protein
MLSMYVLRRLNKAIDAMILNARVDPSGIRLKSAVMAEAAKTAFSGMCHRLSILLSQDENGSPRSRAKAKISRLAVASVVIFPT